MPRPRLFRDLARRFAHPRRNSRDRARLLSRQRLLGQKAHFRLLARFPKGEGAGLRPIRVVRGRGADPPFLKDEPGMVPQDRFIVVAEVPKDRVAPLRALLATMTLKGYPGAADPMNALLPFGAFDTIHFGRLVVLEDNTLGDRAVYPQLPKDEPTYLCFMADCDRSEEHTS